VSKAKNLAISKPQIDGLAGATKDTRGKIIEFAWNLQKEGYKSSTVILWTGCMRRLHEEGGNLFDPESIKEVVAKKKCSESYKATIIIAYSAFARMFDIHWTPPRYKATQKLPFIPTEKEIDALISASGKKLSAFLRTLKETGMRSGEASKLIWIDLDKENSAITVNRPEKNGNPRSIRVTNELISILHALPKKHETVFGGSTRQSMESNFIYQRRNIAKKLQNPRIHHIHFHTFRHWKATMEYNRTKDILYVKKLLGHKRIESTLLYTQLVDFRDHEYSCKAAETVKEAKELVEAGFEYVTSFEGYKLFRKRK